MSSTPTVYFIDDSATMREVIKIAFRRENINVVACHDAATALSEIEKTRPDIVITDVIMPDKDGYDVCQYIKSHPDLAKTPVVLMSGVVNRAVAERAFAVKADELLRKPFQPQDLIARVKHLLKPVGAPAATPAAAASAAAALSSIFGGTPSTPRAAAPMPPRPVVNTPPPAVNGGHPPAGQSTQVATAPPPSASAAVAAPPAPVAPLASSAPVAHPAGKVGTNGHDSRLKFEVTRLENLVKKLQSELEAEREYSRSLEAHIKTLQDS
ncbi:MAG TPA: response regulator [Candidatus Angelobacter sp.]|nr:response regulator [Candidatus Angelobacter sp.]